MTAQELAKEKDVLIGELKQKLRKADQLDRLRLVRLKETEAEKKQLERQVQELGSVDIIDAGTGKVAGKRPIPEKDATGARIRQEKNEPELEDKLDEMGQPLAKRPRTAPARPSTMLKVVAEQNALIKVHACGRADVGVQVRARRCGRAGAGAGAGAQVRATCTLARTLARLLAHMQAHTHAHVHAGGEDGERNSVQREHKAPG